MADQPEQGSTNTDPVDGRIPYDWKSKYPEEARAMQFREAVFLGASIFIALAATWLICLSPRIVLLWANDMPGAPSLDEAQQYALAFLSALLGGLTYASKWLYHSIAKGWWSQDRRYWRIIAPILSSVVGLGVFTALEAGVVNIRISTFGHVFFFGFVGGYFSDRAIGKLGEVADTLFGRSKEKDRTS